MAALADHTVAFSGPGQNLLHPANARTETHPELQSLIIQHDVRTEIYESLLAKRDWITLILESISEEGSLELAIHKKAKQVYVNLPHGSTLWISTGPKKIKDHQLPAFTQTIKHEVIDYLDRRKNLFIELIEFLNTNNTHEIDIMYAYLRYLIETNLLTGDSDEITAFIKDIISKLKNIVSEECNDYLKSTNVFVPFATKENERRSQTSKKKNQHKGSLNVEYTPDLLDDLKVKMSNPSMHFLSKADKRWFEQEIQQCDALQAVIDSNVSNTKNTTVTPLNFYSFTVTQHKLALAFSKKQHFIIEKFNQYFNLLPKVYAEEDQFHATMKNVFAQIKICEKLTKDDSALLLTKAQELKNKLKNKFLQLKLPAEKLTLILNNLAALNLDNKTFTDFKTMVASIFNDLKKDLADNALVDFEKGQAEIDSLATVLGHINRRNEEVQLLTQRLNDIMFPIENLSLDWTDSYLKTKNEGTLEHPNFLTLINSGVSNAKSIEAYLQNLQQKQQDERSLFQEVIDSFEKGQEEEKRKLALAKEAEIHDKIKSDIDAFLAEQKNKTEQFKVKVDKAATEKRETRRQTIQNKIAKDKFDQLKKKRLEENHQSRVNLQQQYSADKFRHFDALVEEILSDPPPHYKIRYSDITNLIEALGGSVTSGRTTGSHRTIKLMGSESYMGILSQDDQMRESAATKSAGPGAGVVVGVTADEPEVKASIELKRAEETSGIVFAHKKRVPTGKLSRFDVKSVRNLLTRCGITLELLASICAAKKAAADREPLPEVGLSAAV